MPFKIKALNYLDNNRMLVFLCCLLSLILCFPFIHEWFSHYLIIIESFFTLLLITGIYLSSRNPQILTISILFAVLSSVIIWFNFFINSNYLLIIGLVLQIIFFLITIFSIISHVLSFQKVNADAIYGAISAYLLLAIIWAIIYTALELAMPESFQFPHVFFHNNALLASHRFYFSQFLYFSFVTITTLGYGDIVPLSLEARGFASIEAVAGQLYVAVLIARLVGLHISHSHWERITQEKEKSRR